jgi:hypothetical protein
MAPVHREIVREVGDGWAVVWDTTNVPGDVREAFKVAREEQRVENAAAAEDETSPQVVKRSNGTRRAA